MGVILAKTAGFCYGVERAVELAKQTAAGGGCVMLGSIIHNAAVVQELEALGARTVDDVSQIQPGETVVIRSHGEPVETYRALEEKGARGGAGKVAGGEAGAAGNAFAGCRADHVYSDDMAKCSENSKKRVYKRRNL